MQPDTNIPVFFLHETDEFDVQLRRFVFSNAAEGKCPKVPQFGHDSVFVSIDRVKWDGVSGRSARSIERLPRAGGWSGDPEAEPVNPYGKVFHADARWPTTCQHCGQPMPATAEYQLRLDPLYRRSDTGDPVTLHNAPAGAMWNASWMAQFPRYRGPDGMSLQVKLPGGHTWCVDSEATNCTRKGDLTHKCWIRHGDPRTPATLHVDKTGETCAAGAGSILIPNWHGFLHHGHLVKC